MGKGMRGADMDREGLGVLGAVNLPLLLEKLQMDPSTEQDD